MRIINQLNTSLYDFFDTWLEFRKKYSSVKAKTINEDCYVYKKYIMGYDFLYIPISHLKVQHFIDYFRLITKDRKLTRKQFCNIKSVLNNMLYLAIERELRQDNPLNNINYRQFAFKPVNRVIEPYTEDERLLLLKHIPNDNIYDLAVKLAFCFCMRIGELLALRYDDIKDNFIVISKFANNNKQIENDIKGHCSSGIRAFPLTSYALELIDDIKRINPNSEYLFVVNGKGLDKNTFNRHLERHCKRLNIKYRSSHKIRFGVASILFNKGLNPTEIQYLLGHSTTAMTMHYLRNVTTMSSTFEKVCNVLN